MSSLDNDDFDTVPGEQDPDDMNEDELRALVKCLLDHAPRCRRVAV